MSDLFFCTLLKNKGNCSSLWLTIDKEIHLFGVVLQQEEEVIHAGVGFMGVHTHKTYIQVTERNWHLLARKVLKG